MAKTQAGIVGLPNVGKSTLFNALTRSRKAEAANYPFCTIEPNVGVVLVPDDRMLKLQVIASTSLVFPVPVGPRNKKFPTGRPGLVIPAKYIW